MMRGELGLGSAYQGGVLGFSDIECAHCVCAHV